MEAFFAPDGTRIFFAPYDDGKDIRIWLAEVTPDGHYLFFSRYIEPDGISNIYWVSSAVIAHAAPTDGETADLSEDQ